MKALRLAALLALGFCGAADAQPSNAQGPATGRACLGWMAPGNPR